MRIKHLLIGLITAAAAIACKQEDPVIVPEMNLSQTVATVSADGGNVSFEVTSNVDWTASYSEDWVSVSPSAGKSSSSPVKVSVSVDPNESAASRNATVTISADKISKTFKVSQEGKVEEKPVPVEITWGVVGALVGNDWKSDVAMSKNGSWLVAEGVEFEEVTLHVGAGTFLPVKEANAANHPMHTEHFEVRLATLRNLRRKHGSIIAVGTTSVRTLESIAALGYRVKCSGTPDCERTVGQWELYDIPAEGGGAELLDALIEYMEREGLDRLKTSTQIMITPCGYRFRIVEGIVTNFHQPRSTLLLLVSALVGDDWHAIYDYALANDFRFLSYGDSSILLRK